MAGCLYLTYFGFTQVPTGFIPSQDKGYLLVDVRLPDSSSLERTQAVMAQVEQIARGDGVFGHDEPRLSGHAGGGIPGIAPHDHHLRAVDRAKRDRLELRNGVRRARRVSPSAWQRPGRRCDCGRSCAPPATARCRRLGRRVRRAGRRRAGQCRRIQSHGPRHRRRWASIALQEAADGLAASGNEQPGLVGLFSAFRAQTPQMYVDIDRERCKAMGVPLNEVFLTLQLYLGGYYTNDFNQFGRTWQVNLQGDPQVPPDARAGAAAEGPQSARAKWFRWAASPTSAKSAARPSSFATTA